MAEAKANARSSRDSQSHDNQTRRKPWRPVRSLETPPPPAGYTYRWIRESMLGQEDRANVSRRIREGWELVRGLIFLKNGVLYQQWTMDGTKAWFTTKGCY